MKNVLLTVFNYFLNKLLLFSFDFFPSNHNLNIHIHNEVQLYSDLQQKFIEILGGLIMIISCLTITACCSEKKERKKDFLIQANLM